MTRSYGEIAADDIMDENEFTVMAALGGDRLALRTMLSSIAQSGYTAGYGAAASVVGVTL